MSVDEHWSELLDDSLHALVSMEPNRIERVEERIAHRLTGDRTEAMSAIDRSLLPTLRLTHAAAVKAAQLWRGSVPQPGYGADGPIDPVGAKTSLSVTG